MAIWICYEVKFKIVRVCLLYPIPLPPSISKNSFSRFQNKSKSIFILKKFCSYIAVTRNYFPRSTYFIVILFQKVNPTIWFHAYLLINIFLLGPDYSLSLCSLVYLFNGILTVVKFLKYSINSNGLLWLITVGFSLSLSFKLLLNIWSFFGSFYVFEIKCVIYFSKYF